MKADDAALDRASYLALRHRSYSDTAKSVSDGIANQIGQLRRRRATKKQLQATDAALADLVRIIDDGDQGYLFRSVMAETFTGEAVGRAPFIWAYTGLEEAGLITVTKGRANLADRSGNVASRFRPTGAFIERVRSAGIGQGEWRQHFSLAPDATAAPLVIVRNASKKRLGERGMRRVAGKAVKPDLNNGRVRDDMLRLAKLNDFLRSRSILPQDAFAGLTRIYNNADAPGFAYKQGGRLYDLNGNYQGLKEVDRLRLTMDGEHVAEIDLKGSHITILRILLGIQFDPMVDPYMQDYVHRSVMKSYITMALGHSTLPNTWLPGVKKRFAKRSGGVDLGEIAKAKDVKEYALKLHPFLSNWEKCEFRWDRLQFEESEIIFDAVFRLYRDHGIPALPVHDSLIVPVSKVNLACEVLRSSFSNRLGIEPVLDVDYREC